MLTADEVRKHDSRRSCWVIISGQAYDVTDFLNEHPGGPSSILRLAGKVRVAQLTEDIGTDVLVGRD